MLRRLARPAYFAGVVCLVVAVELSRVGGVTLARPLAATAPELGQASGFSVIGKAGVTNTGNSVLSGKVGADSSITGFPPGSSAGMVLAPAVNGAEADATTADLALTAQAGSATPVSPNLTGQTLVPGVYSTGSALLPGVLTLNGPGVYVFLVASDLTASGSVSLINGASACNVFWHVTSAAHLTGGSFVGTIIAGTSVTFGNGVSLDGRVLALTGNVTLINNHISGPGCAQIPPPPGATVGQQPSYVSVESGCAVNGQGPVTVGLSAGVIVYGLGADITSATDTGLNKIVRNLPVGHYEWHATPPAGHYMQATASGVVDIVACGTSTALATPVASATLTVAQPTVAPAATQTSPSATRAPTQPAITPTGPVPTVAASATPLGTGIPKPQTSVSDGHPEYPGAYLGWLQLPNGKEYPVYAAVLDANGNLLIPGDGYVFWNGYFIGHLVQPRGWTLLPTGGEITWQTDHTTVFQIGGSEAEMTYTGTLDALPKGVFRFVTCWIDYSATRYSQQPVWGGNLVVDLDVR
jgi:Ice-binding-like